MAVKIDSRIINATVRTGPGPSPPRTPERETPASAAQPPAPALENIDEHTERQETLSGRTYKIKPPTLDHAMYVTINDIILNEGTEYEIRRPFEIFINSKNMAQAEWITALTRLMSAVFRKGGNVAFIVEELKSIFAPQGGYLKPGGKFMPSVVAELGTVVERHLVDIGLIEADRLDEHQRRYLGEKVEQLAENELSFSEQAAICTKCFDKAVIVLDGCETCLTCGNSKCEN